MVWQHLFIVRLPVVPHKFAVSHDGELLIDVLNYGSFLVVYCHSFVLFSSLFLQHPVPQTPTFKPSMSVPDCLVAVQNYMKALQYPLSPSSTGCHGEVGLRLIMFGMSVHISLSGRWFESMDVLDNQHWKCCSVVATLMTSPPVSSSLRHGRQHLFMTTLQHPQQCRVICHMEKSRTAAGEKCPCCPYVAVRYNHTGTQFFEIKKSRPLYG